MARGGSLGCVAGPRICATSLGGTMKPARALLLVGIMLPSVSHVSAQVRPAATGVDYTVVLKRQLRSLVTAQETYWADHGTYTTDVSALGIYKPRGAATDSVWIQVIQAGGRSWWGRAIHCGRRGKSCGIYVGQMEDFTAPPATDAAKAQPQH